MPQTPLLARHEAAGAHLVEEAGWRMPAHFGDPGEEHRACRAGAVLIDLSHRGKLRFSGSDAAEFLHGMLSNRVSDLAAGEGSYSTFLTRQGKIVSDLTLYRTEEDIAADLPPGMAPRLAEALDAYIIMEQIEVEDRTESLAALGAFGPGARAGLAAAGLEVPGLPEHGHIERKGVRIARELWTGEEGYLLTTPAGEAEGLWDALAGAGLRPAGLAAFETLSLEAGVPLYGKDMSEAVNPMQAGLELRAIDFEKGCYLGQEVVAKIKYLGQVNRGLVGIRIEGDAVPEGNAKVLFGEEEVGALTRAALSPTEGKVLALAYLHRRAMAPGTKVGVRLGEAEAAGEVVALPFYGGGEAS
ncbi:MAG: glycine cleavage T C-terminal barrel domain-containing protein [bacterium]